MWQRLISISLSISQVMGMDAFSVSHRWATFVLILWYSDMHGLFHLWCYVCVRVYTCQVCTCVFRSDYSSKCITSQYSCYSLFEHKMEPLLSLTNGVRQAKWPRLVCIHDVVFFFFLTETTSSEPLLMWSGWWWVFAHSLHTRLWVKASIFHPLCPSGSRPLSLEEVTASLWVFTLTSFNYSFTSFHVC